LLLGFSLIAGACGSDDGADAAPAATTAAPAATTAAPAATTAAPAAEEAAADSSDPIKLPIHNWSSQIAGVYAVGAMLESTGNSVEYISADSTLVYTSMCEGDMDLVHEVWEGAFGVAFMEQVDAGCVIDAATHDAKTREEWWYPSYIEDVCPGLPDWQALNACAAMFATPDSGGKGRFLGGPVDRLKGDQERVEGLGMDFIVENAGTAGALWAAVEAASANQEPIVLFNWTPNFIEAMYDGKFIEFPTFADECRTDASWGLNPETTHDCGNPKDGYLKLGVWEGFPAKWPNAYAAVQNMNFSNLDIAQLAMYGDIDGMSLRMRLPCGWLRTVHAGPAGPVPTPAPARQPPQPQQLKRLLRIRLMRSSCRFTTGRLRSLAFTPLVRFWSRRATRWSTSQRIRRWCTRRCVKATWTWSTRSGKAPLVWPSWSRWTLVV